MKRFLSNLAILLALAFTSLAASPAFAVTAIVEPTTVIEKNVLVEQLATQETAMLTIFMCIRIPGCASAALKAPSNGNAFARVERKFLHEPSVFRGIPLAPYEMTSWKKALWWIII